jgi:hypothetical protein
MWYVHIVTTGLQRVKGNIWKAAAEELITKGKRQPVKYLVLHTRQLINVLKINTVIPLCDVVAEKQCNESFVSV